LLFFRGFPMDTWGPKLRLFAFFLACLLACSVITSAEAQGVPATGGLDLASTNPFGMPGTTAGLPQGSNSLYLNSGMFCDILPRISNLEIGYLYQFGNVISTGRLTFDYVLPAYPTHDSAAFGEAHAEFTNFGKTLQRIFSSGNTTTTERGYPDRIDLSFGGGYRKIFGDNLLLGVNAFGDTSKLADQWYGSGGVGFEMAALGVGNDLVELNFNFYGNLFQGRNSIINAFRNGPGNFDVSARYSIELGDYGPDLRLKATGYQFDVGTKQYGFNTEAELRSRNGVFSVKAGTGHDPVNGWYHTVGGFVNVGLDFANLLKGESPFEMPEPIFRSPRNLRRLLTQNVDRNYISPPANTARAACPPNACPIPPIVPTLVAELYLYAPSVMAAGESICFDIPDTTLDAGYKGFHETRIGTRGALRIFHYEGSDDCTSFPLGFGSYMLNGDRSLCIYLGPPIGSRTYSSIGMTCTSPGGCDAGCITVQLRDDH
jgi:hypothetical protein